MRSQTPLTLIEQTVMLLVFALAAVLCLQVFVWSEKTSAGSEAVDNAAIEAQTAAEIVKSCRGDWKKAAGAGEWQSAGEGWTASYDADWQRTDGKAAFALTVTPQNDDDPYLGQAEVTVTEAEGETLFSLPVCWQEVNGHG